MLVLGDGSALRCVRGSDGFRLWQLPIEGKLVQSDGAPTFDGRQLYVSGGSAGVLCLDPKQVIFDGKEQDVFVVQGELEQRWQNLLAKYEVEKKKAPQAARPPDENMLPRSLPKRIWQQGQDRWQVEGPVALVDDCVLATSVYLEDEKVGERALVCLKVSDGSVRWKTPLSLSSWAGPTVGPYVLVGCSSTLPDPKAIAGARGEVVAMELDTGAVKWRKEVPGGVLSSVAVKGGLAIFTFTPSTWPTARRSGCWTWQWTRRPGPPAWCLALRWSRAGGCTWPHAIWSMARDQYTTWLSASVRSESGRGQRFATGSR
jgi:hypothetical protein